MRSGLFWKLFLLQVLAAATVLAGALAVTRIYSIRGFAEYLESRERERVQVLTAELAKAYAQTGDLAQAAESLPALRRRLHRGGFAGRVLMLAPGMAGAYGPAGDVVRAGEPAPGLQRRLYRGGRVCAGERCPPDGGPPFEFGVEPVPPGFDPPPEMGLDVFEERIGGVEDHFPAEGPTFVAFGIPPLQLQDPLGTYLLGDPMPLSANGPREPITVDGRIVGYLAWPRFPGYPEQAEFARKQERRFAIIGPIALVLSAVFAALITALIVRPIRQLSSGTAALARREFGTRLPVQRRDELGRLAADFNRLAESLAGYDARQRQWLADIAHELRTPVSVLRGELEAVLDGVRPADADTVRSLRQEVARLEALIQDLHLVALAESGGLRLTLAESDVGELALQSTDRFREQFKARKFELATIVEKGLRAIVDAQRLEQVLANLLENALRHASPPGPVTLAVGASNGEVRLSVADAGPGVPAEALPRLFDRLYRADSARSRAAGGAGLGLSICKSIVEAHGGTIEARAASAGGLEIVIRLPVGAPHVRDSFL